MSQWILDSFNMALVLLEDCMLFLLAEGFFTKKRSNTFVSVSFLALTLLGSGILYLVGESVIAKLLASIGIFIVWIYLCYDTSLIKCLFPVLFWLAFLEIGDNALLALLSSVMQKSFRELMHDPGSYYFICFSIKAAELLGIVIIHTWMKRHFTRTHTTFLDWLRVIAFPLGTMLVSILLLRIYYFVPTMSWELAVCNALILLVDIVSIFLLNYLERQQEAVRDNIILRQNIKTELDNVEAWRKAYDGQRKQTHDFQNQLLVIYGLVDNRAPSEEILEYISRLQKVELPGTLMVKTHRTVVDIILNQKYAIAESREIRLLSQLDDLSAFPLPDDALIIVLSNLIDNAIEACMKIENTSDRYISLKMKREQQAAFLHIENPTAAPVSIVNNRIVTTKRNPIEHGYGLQNVISVLERHKAIYLLDYDRDSRVFSFSAQLAVE